MALVYPWFVDTLISADGRDIKIVICPLREHFSCRLCKNRVTRPYVDHNIPMALPQSGEILVVKIRAAKSS